MYAYKGNNFTWFGSVYIIDEGALALLLLELKKIVDA